MSLRVRAASLALGATVGLTALKLGASLYSNSVGIWSEGIHSLLDLMSAAISYFTIREAGKPADEDHPFGHEKIETLSSLFESLLLVFAAIWIVYEGFIHLFHPEPLQHETVAIVVMVLSMGVSYWVYRHNGAAAHETQSSALQVNALHFLADVMASLGVLVGLCVIRVTGWVFLDAWIALGVAAYILFVTWGQLKKALLELSDTQIPEREIQLILDVLRKKTGEVRDLRTRKSGPVRHIYFHWIVCGRMTVENSHAICDELELEIEGLFPKSRVTIHVEPCEKETTQCHLTCAIHSRGTPLKLET
jgi:cation diffusion facilitator family transporter